MTKNNDKMKMKRKKTKTTKSAVTIQNREKICTRMLCNPRGGQLKVAECPVHSDLCRVHCRILAGIKKNKKKNNKKTTEETTKDNITFARLCQCKKSR